MEFFYMPCQATIEEQGETILYIDSGCSNLTTANESLFYDIDTSIKAQVRLENGASVEAKGKVHNHYGDKERRLMGHYGKKNRSWEVAVVKMKKIKIPLSNGDIQKA